MNPTTTEIAVQMNPTSTSYVHLPEPNLPRGDLLNGSREDYFNICVPLFQASITGDWATAKVILDERQELVRFAISEDYYTASTSCRSIGRSDQADGIFCRKSGG